MSTTMPRINVAFDRPTYEVLEDVSKTKHVSLSAVVAKLVKNALELSEDLALVHSAEKRLKTFRRGQALDTDALLRWNRSR
jgi:hypothetical protein